MTHLEGGVHGALKRFGKRLGVGAGQGDGDVVGSRGGWRRWRRGGGRRRRGWGVGLRGRWGRRGRRRSHRAWAQPQPQQHGEQHAGHPRTPRRHRAGRAGRAGRASRARGRAAGRRRGSTLAPPLLRAGASQHTPTTPGLQQTQSPKSVSDSETTFDRGARGHSIAPKTTNANAASASQKPPNEKSRERQSSYRLG